MSVTRQEKLLVTTGDCAVVQDATFNDEETVQTGFSTRRQDGD
jgi:hypothetical protein